MIFREMQNYKIIVQYDGTKYQGWQIQRSSDQTIQGKISAVLSKMADTQIEVVGSGRTDAGVHALGQVANFFMPEKFSENQIINYLNEYLPEDIAVCKIQKVDERFHARFSCKSKTYRYRIFISNIPNVFERKYYYQYLDAKIDVNLMKNAVKYLIGEHDFKSFCGNTHIKKSTIRTIFSIDIQSTENEIIIDYSGDGFLQNMVRILTGTLIEIGTKQILLDTLPQIITSKNRQLAGFTAPPQGLTLLKVEY
ncbi:MAG: tRNA pseudouridine(38-40) synthase TruA [Bacteroidales bacterium]|nr:tRNA pseudouridine(38-40) synthase TruA [Bacteroidales bacterium]